MTGAATVAVGGILFDADRRVLLIQRGREPGRGLWTLPGGRVELGETLAQACIREFSEETGLEIEIDCLVDVVDRIDRDAAGQVRYHYVICDYLVRQVGGRLEPGSDATGAQFVAVQELAGLPHSHGLAPVLGKALLLI